MPEPSSAFDPPYPSRVTTKRHDAVFWRSPATQAWPLLRWRSVARTSTRARASCLGVPRPRRPRVAAPPLALVARTSTRPERRFGVPRPRRTCRAVAGVHASRPHEPGYPSGRLRRHLCQPDGPRPFPRSEGGGAGDASSATARSGRPRPPGPRPSPPSPPPAPPPRRSTSAPACWPCSCAPRRSSPWPAPRCRRCTPTATSSSASASRRRSSPSSGTAPPTATGRWPGSASTSTLLRRVPHRRVRHVQGRLLRGAAGSGSACGSASADPRS